MDNIELIYVSISLVSLLIGIGIGYYMSKQSKSEIKLKNDLTNLELENIQLRSDLAEMKSPANDIQSLKMKLSAHITENEINIKKIFEYEKQIRDYRERELERKKALESEEIINRKLRELNKKIKQAELYFAELNSGKQKSIDFTNPIDDSTMGVEEESNTNNEEVVTVNTSIAKINFDRIGRASFFNRDDLRQITGIGQSVEQKLNNVGIFTLQQIANFTEEDVKIVNEAIEFFPGRIAKDNWVGQARKILKSQSK